jgi:protein-L-isoaspartate(D-aspartate) O-methyltransferase
MVRLQIAQRGIRDPGVLGAMQRVPRERFVPEGYRDEAYEDRALPIACGQTISQPYMVAYMTEMLGCQPGMKVLEVGTGSGYQAAVLAQLGCQLHTIERLEALSDPAQRLLAELGIGPIAFHIGDGCLGVPAEAPFDRILVTAGAPRVPPALVEQLLVGGRLVIPVGEPDHQVVVRVDRLEGRIVETPGVPCRFVRLVGQQGWGPPTPNEAAED